MLSGGVGELDGKLFRIGHMGPVAHPTYLTAGLGALERALADLGYPVAFGAGVGAALEALAGWSDWRRDEGSRPSPRRLRATPLPSSGEGGWSGVRAGVGVFVLVWGGLRRDRRSSGRRCPTRRRRPTEC